jgi:hypothetical protein
MTIAPRWSRGPPKKAWASKTRPIAAPKVPWSSPTRWALAQSLLNEKKGHTELDGRLLLALLAVLREQLLPPSLHDKHVVDRHNVNVLDTLGLELVVSLDVSRNLVRAGGGEAVSSVLVQAQSSFNRLTLRERER